MHYTGLDVHKRSIQVQHMTDDGALGISMKIPAATSSLSSFLDGLDDPTAICFEASGTYWWLSQFLEAHPKVREIKVVDPRRSRALAEELSVQSGYGRAKNDRIDAEMLAQLHQRNIAPAIVLPSAKQLQIRTLVRHRSLLTWESTRVSSRIQALLAMHGVTLSTKRLLEMQSTPDATFESLPDYVQFTLQQFIAQLRLYQQQRLECEKHIDKCLPEKAPQIKRLMSAPGIGIVCARILISEIFSISNFDSPAHLVSYAGLAPVTSESAGQKGVCKLNRFCNYHLKYAFVTAAHAARTDLRYKKKYQQDVKKHGKIRAKLNLARKIAKAVYWMLTRQQDFKR